MKKLQLTGVDKGLKCKIKGCRKDYVSFGFCLDHFLQAEKEWQNKSKKPKLLAR